ncbi:MAG: arylesterase, partial [Pseudomonadota bacterium]
AEARQQFMQSDGIHPNRAGVEVIVEALGPRVMDLVTRAKPES